MGVRGKCGLCCQEVREIGQTARLFPRSLGDFTKRGGVDMSDSTPPGPSGLTMHG